MSQKTALIVGATGLVGRELLNVVLAQDYYSKILIVGRSSPGIKDNRIEELLIDFEKLNEYSDKISANDYYCCLGTTMSAAKSKEAFYHVDFTYTHNLAKLAKRDPNFEQFHLVSSYGANAQSGLFYNAVKGQIEETILDMDLRALHIYQPSLLLGFRKDFRLWEEMAKMVSNILSFFIIGSRLRFWAIRGHEVARAMFFVAQSNDTGNHVHKPLEMKRVSQTKIYLGDNSVAKSK